MKELKQVDVAEFVKPERKRRKKKEERGRDVPIVSFVMLAGLVLFVIGVAYGIESYARWRAGHQWQSPIVFRLPWREVFLETSVEAEVKSMSEEQIMEQYHLSPVLKTVYFLESTSGKNDGCKDEGLVNGYGYRQNSHDWKCYESFEQVTDKVNEWFEERLATNGNDLVEAVCFYNKGIQGLQVCDYSINFMGVLTKNF